MKRRAVIFLTAFLLIATLLLSSCEVTVFGGSVLAVKETEITAENERYMIWGNMLIDKQEGQIYALKYERNERVSSSAWYQSGYTNTTGFEFTDGGILQHTYLEVPKYDQDTGAVAYHEYYKTVITFDYYGQEIAREDSDVALSEEEMLAESKPERPISSSDVFSFAKEQGSGRSRYELEEDAPTYTAIQQKAVDYAFSLEKKLLGEYHLICGKGKMIDGRLWFSVERYNKKDFMGQSAVAQGLYHSMVVCYDPSTDTFERKIEFGKSKHILAFDDTHVMVAKDGKLFSYCYETGKGEKLFHLEESFYFEATDDIFHIYRLDCIKGESADGKMQFSYPCEYHVFMKLDGTPLVAGHKLGKEEKDTVKTAKHVECEH